MRSLRFILLIALLNAPWYEAEAAMCVSLGDGNWNAASTWSCGHAPTGGDTLIIASGHTVSVTQNHVYNGLPLHLKVYGVWYFSGGGSKITLPCGSVVEIMPGGLVQPNSNSGGHSESVRICGVTYWYYDQGPQTGYQIWPSPPLPVELVAFDVSADAGTALITWITGSEHNSDHFEVSRSRDGGSWEIALVVSAQGSSVTTTHYGGSDTPVADGLWYYRLVQVDDDGTRNDEGIRAVMLRTGGENLICAPNPVTDGRLMIISNVPFAASDLLVFSAAQPVEQHMQLHWESDQRLMLDVSGLSPGLYVARVTAGAENDHCTFVVQ